MAAEAAPPAAARSSWSLPALGQWHRPLLILAILMGVLTAACIVMAIVDPQQILGQNAWFKPLKFAISTGIYAVTMAWIVGQIRKRRRLAEIFGTVTTIAVIVEDVIIVGAAGAGATSHFNVATPLNTTLWVIMATDISVVWLATLVVGVVAAREPGPDTARNLAVRAGVLLGLIGMALAVLMTLPTASQLSDFKGIAGAHAVGVADGGPGLPFLGWSTVGGDLRIPHFVGMHALQAIPLFLVVIELLSRRIRVLRSVRVRFGLVAITALAYAGIVAIITVQALLGQSLVHPSAAIAGAAVAVIAAALVAAIVVVVSGRGGRRARRFPAGAPIARRS